MNNWDGKRVKDWSVYIGRRCLVVEDSLWGEITEVLIKKVSPSKKRAKFRFQSGVEVWEDCRHWLLIECLEAK